MSWLARERKKREAEFAEKGPDKEVASLNFLPIFGFLSVFLGSFLYCKYRTKKEPVVVVKVTPKPKKTVKFKSMVDEPD